MHEFRQNLISIKEAQAVTVFKTNMYCLMKERPFSLSFSVLFWN